MQVEIWADVVCPWCRLGKARFLAALARFPHRDEVTVIERSFQLDPSAPPGPGIPVRELLQRKYGMDEARFRATTAHIEALAAAEGLAPYHVGDNTSGNTALAHQLIAFAADHGKRAEAWDRLYHAYFGERRGVFDVASLLPLAADLGLDVDAVREALRSGAYADVVAADQSDARRLGVSGVPFFAIDRAVGVSGAQAADVFARVLDEAWARRVVTAPDADGCGPDVC